MYEGPGGVVALEPVVFPPGGGPFLGAPLSSVAGGPRPFSRRSVATSVLSVTASAGPLLPSGVGGGVSSPRRFDRVSVVESASSSPYGSRRTSAATGKPLSLSVLMGRSDLDECEGDIMTLGLADPDEDFLPSAVPDTQSFLRRLPSAATAARSHRAISVSAASPGPGPTGFAGSLPAPGSPGAALRGAASGDTAGGGSRAVGAAASGGDDPEVWPRDLPSSRGQSFATHLHGGVTGALAGPGVIAPGGRSLRAATVSLTAGAPVPHPPGAPQATPVLRSPPSARRSLLLTGGPGAVSTSGEASRAGFGGGGVREELEVEEDPPLQPRSSVIAWTPTAASAPGSFAGAGSTPLSGRSTGSISGPALPRQANPQLSQSVGFSRQPEDLPAAPLPSHSRSLAGGSQASTPGSQQGRPAGRPSPLLMSQGSIASSGGGSSVGFSRRLEDLPAAPSPSHSRSLAGGLGRSGASTPASPAQGANGTGGSRGAEVGLQGQGQGQEVFGMPYKTSVGSGFGQSSWRVDSGSTSGSTVPALPATYSGEAPARPHLPTSTPAASGASVSGTGWAPVSLPGAPVSQHVPSPTPPSPRAGTAAPLHAFVSGPTGGSPASQSVGFSRRAEDLLAAPSPSHSRSLAGGAGSSAGSSVRSPSGATEAGAMGRWSGTPLESPRTPVSPPVSVSVSGGGGGGGGGVGLSRRPEDLPAAPSPSFSRSLRPDSSRAVFRSHATPSATSGGLFGGGSTPRSPMTGQDRTAAGAPRGSVSGVFGAPPPPTPPPPGPGSRGPVRWPPEAPGSHVQPYQQPQAQLQGGSSRGGYGGGIAHVQHSIVEDLSVEDFS